MTPLVLSRRRLSLCNSHVSLFLFFSFDRNPFLSSLIVFIWCWFNCWHGCGRKSFMFEFETCVLVLLYLKMISGLSLSRLTPSSRSASGKFRRAGGVSLFLKIIGMIRNASILIRVALQADPTQMWQAMMVRLFQLSFLWGCPARCYFDCVCLLFLLLNLFSMLGVWKVIRTSARNCGLFLRKVCRRMILVTFSLYFLIRFGPCSTSTCWDLMSFFT